MSGDPSERGAGARLGGSLLAIAAGVGVFIVCSIIQGAGGTSMFATSFKAPDNFLLELLVQVTFYPGWAITLGLIGIGVFGVFGAMADASSPSPPSPSTPSSAVTRSPSPSAGAPSAAQAAPLASSGAVPPGTASPSTPMPPPPPAALQRRGDLPASTKSTTPTPLPAARQRLDVPLEPLASAPSPGPDPGRAAGPSAVPSLYPMVPPSSARSDRPPATAPSPSPVVPEHDGLTQRRPGASVAVTRTYELRFDDGLTVAVDGLMLIGRQPAAGPDEAAKIVPVADPSCSVSKTHLAVGVDTSGPWMIDRHSTNGTTVFTADGEVTLVPGVRTPLSPGEVVHAGDRSFVVAAQDGGPQ